MTTSMTGVKKLKKVLFICGSPSGEKSTSFVHADFMAHFIKYTYEFISLYETSDPTKPILSAHAQEKEEVFLKIVNKMENADALVWVSGAQCYFVPVQMQYLFEKLLAQNYYFKGKIAATLLTTYGVLDDYIHEKIRDVSEQLGFGHIGDISISGSPFDFNSNESESQCRALAGKINRALASSYVPPRETDFIERKYLSPVIYGDRDFYSVKTAPEIKPEIHKTGKKTIILISGSSISNDPAALFIYNCINAYSRNNIKLIEIENCDIKPCVYCRECILSVTGECCLKDEYSKIEKQLFLADGIIYLGNCGAGIIDSRLRTFLGRTGKLLNQPSLRDKHGFVIATGGGPLGKSGAKHLEYFMGIHGINNIATLTDSIAEPDQFSHVLQWTIQNLDLAMEEKWQAPDRFPAIGEHLIVRDVSIEFGYVVRGNYNFYKNEKRYNYPCRLLTAILYPFFSNTRFRKTFEKLIINHFLKKKKKRLATISY
ncbi:MAG: hypothetical protein C0403_06855 [Desulfobacterium sp.]|nr:hypothetical protein [Desulfobacterium sp.]